MSSEKRKLDEAVDPSSDTTSTPASDESTVLQAYKRARINETALIPTSASPSPSALSSSALPPRTSSLPAPTVSLTGHQAAVLCCAFSPSGRLLVTAGLDKAILLWSLADACKNVALLKGHTAAVLNAAWLGDGELVSASVDGAALWDVETSTRVKRLRHHDGVVNAVATSSDPNAFLTAGDDGCVLLYDRRAMKRYAGSLVHPYQVLAAALSSSLQQLWHAGIDPAIQCVDLRALSSSSSSTSSPAPVYSLPFHTDSVTGLAVNADSTLLLSHSLDASLHCHSVVPFVPPASSRLLQRYVPAPHDHERNLLRCQFSPDSSLLAGGSGDRQVNVWETGSGALRWRLPGHKGCVNEVAFHPSEPIIASAGNDKKVFLGEL